MINQPHNTSKLNSESSMSIFKKIHKKSYQPPTLTPLLDCEPETGSANVPETDNGLLES